MSSTEAKQLAESRCAAEDAAQSRRVDRWLVALVACAAALALAVAGWWPPQSFAGGSVRPHMPLLATLLVGGSSAAVVIWLSRRHPGQARTRRTVAAAAMLVSMVFVHLGAARGEAYLAAFVTLLVVSAYRDWRALVIAAGVFLIDESARAWLVHRAGPSSEAIGMISALERSAYFVLVTAAAILCCRLVDAERRRATLAAVERDLTREQLERAQAQLREHEQAVMDEADRQVIAMLAGSAATGGSDGGEQTIRQLRAIARASEAHAQTAGEALARSLAHCQQLATSLRDHQHHDAELIAAGSAMAEVADRFLALAQQQRRLALNGAIAAAHAGQHGAEIGNVADQMHALADSTTDASRRLQQIAARLLPQGAELVAIATRTEQQALDCRAEIELATRTMQSIRAIASELGLSVHHAFAADAEPLPDDESVLRELQMLVE